ncbi:shikimate dehydrogenase family protein [Crocinitomix catalasitica]|uniref:shikimate dehydrogenase family protein n=1 Tax=Crocinitomix catalasitica TaxID=184607 RepID=UPI00048807FC|nr:shikimate dehydrogenase [Crocinitomix catalasitica]
MKKFGLIGQSLTHSFSKSYFEDKFRKLDLDFEYENIEIDKIEKVKPFLRDGFTGFNVTSPYKTEVIPFLDELSETASQVNAVNTVIVKEGRLIGDNTDVYGFKQMIKPYFKSHHERAMILGTGGASKAVAKVLEDLGANVLFISRNPKTPNEFCYEEVNELMVKFNSVIVNTTPVGMYPNSEEILDFPYEYLTAQHLVIDLIYNPKETQFLKIAKENDAVVLNGLTMLHQQAERSWELWKA